MILVVLAVSVIHMLLSLRIKRDSTSILFAAAVYNGCFGLGALGLRLTI